MNKFKQDDVVEYTGLDFKGCGKVIGLCGSVNTIFDQQYIVLDLSGNLSNEIYPYKAFCCYGNNLKLRDFNYEN